MYTAKICLNSVLGERIYFILGWLHLSPSTAFGIQTACHGNAGCLSTGPKIPDFMTTYFSIANNSNWCKCPPRGSGDVTQITLADSLTRSTGWQSLCGDCAYC